MVNIVITGGTGYIGARCALELVRRGYYVSVIDKVKPEDRGFSFPSDIKFIHGDLRNPKVALVALQNAQVVLHLAANIGSLNYMHEHQAEIMQENCAIDAALYPAALAAGKPCIIYSSSSMVFQGSTVFPYREEDLDKVYLPTNVYGMSKLVGEYFCRSYFVQYGLPFVIIRYHNIYGPGEDSKGASPGDIHVIPALIEKVLSGQYPLELLGGEYATRPFTYVDDAVTATIALVEKVAKGDKTIFNTDFNVGPSEATKILDLANLIWQLLGDERPFRYTVKKTKAITAERREMIADKIIKAINWNPKIDLKTGIFKTAEWIRRKMAGEKTTILG